MAYKHEQKPSIKQENDIFPVIPFRFNNVWPYYRKPVEIGGFSLDAKRTFYDNRKRLKEYKPPPPSENLNFDLRVGYGSFVRRNDEIPERLDHLLLWINLHQNKFWLPGVVENNGSLNTDFITARGHLTKILCTPYETREPWQMDACKFNGTIYISEVETEIKKMQRQSETQMQKQMCYWGYKFESYMTKPFQDLEDANDSVNNSECFCSVLRSRLNKHSIVMVAEVDCCILIDGKIRPPDSYVELKTTRLMQTSSQRRNYSNFKLKKFWAQSYLAGVPKVVCGLRDDDGIVHKTEDYNTLEIPKIASSNGATWKGEICMNFCDAFLHWLKEIVIEDDLNIVYSFHFDKPFNTIVAKRQTKRAEFIPDWFIDGLTKKGTC